MRSARIESGIVIFLLFFGTAMVDSVRRHAWATSMIYVLLALLFLQSRPRGESRGDEGASRE